MRMLRIAALALGTVVLTAPPAFSQDILRELGRILDADGPRNDIQRQDTDRTRGRSGSSDEYGRGSSAYRGYSDREIRTEFERLTEQRRQIDAELRALRDELQARSGSR